MSHEMKTVLIAGPTASGKSALALAVAERFGGTVINADSMQVYRDLRTITARPTPDEETRVPHTLYGHVDAAMNYSTGQWLREIDAAVTDIRAQGRLPIVVGGTGLYFTALTKGIAAVPPTPAAIRNEVRARLTAEGIGALYSELLRLDPATAHRLMPNDRSRIARALEVLKATGRSLLDWHREGMPSPIDTGRSVKIFLKTERAALVERIETRFGAMLQTGAIEEVRTLAARQLDPLLPAMKAHGVPWLVRHLNGEISLENATAGAVMDTRRYAKRQLTWFRNQLPDWTWIEPERAEAFIAEGLSQNPQT
jgi:tRNA dimethylallyltransferase